MASSLEFLHCTPLGCKLNLTRGQRRVR